MAEQWRAILASLRDSFEGIAIQSRGVFHTMVERQQIRVKDTDESPEPPGWKDFAVQHPEAAQQIGGPPGDPPRLRALSPEESAAAPPPSDDDPYIRDKRGFAHAIKVPSIIRDGFLCGDRNSVNQFRTLAEAAGRVFRTLPPDVLSVLPPTLADIPQKQWTVDRRYVFGEVTGPRPGWMGRGWIGGMALYEKGVIVDSPEAGAGSRDGAELWLLVLHRLGWMGGRSSLVNAHRYFWRANYTVAYELVHPPQGTKIAGQFPDVAEEIPKHRFYSVFGEGRGEPTDMCWVSTWALEELLAITASAVGTAETMRAQLRSVEEAKTKKSKGVALEQLMTLMFNSVDGFHVRGRNVKTKTEEIDLILDNKCLVHPWDSESAIVLVECKNWSKPAGKNEITLFESKIKNRRGRCTIGFFIAWNGFAKTVEKQLLRSSQEKWMIVPLTGEQIRSAIRSRGFTQLLDAAWHDVLRI